VSNEDADTNLERRAFEASASRHAGGLGSELERTRSLRGQEGSFAASGVGSIAFLVNVSRIRSAERGDGWRGRAASSPTTCHSAKPTHAPPPRRDPK
jgi:hypothetical protein